MDERRKDQSELMTKINSIDKNLEILKAEYIQEKEENSIFLRNIHTILEKHNNAIYGNGDSVGLRTEVHILKDYQAKTQKHYFAAWSAFIVGIINIFWERFK